MMKQIAVVAMEKEYAKTLCDFMSDYLSKYGEFHYYSLAEVESMDCISEDFVTIATFTIFEGVRRKMCSSSELIVVNVTLNKQGIQPLYQLPKGTRALLVNFDYRTCVQAITDLYGAGFNYLELIPYFGQGDYDPSIKLAITPNERRLVPEGIQHVIDIGERVVDFNCLYHIAERLSAAEVFVANEGVRAKKVGYFSNFGMERVLGENENLTERVHSLIKLMKQGIILTDIVGNIHTCNEKAQKLLRSRSDLLVGFKISELLPELRVFLGAMGKQEWGASEETREELISLNGENLIASATSILVKGTVHGFIITLDNFAEVEEKQHGMRTRLSQVEHVARYHFEDIKGQSPLLAEAVVAARRMAQSDASVLIMGESGTGKEVFAQSIHNDSPRSRYNFVAVNCAAIPENLLESEMFGYEEGSFTGAKKGGKIGYFELAHKGTIFLDEIGEMPLRLQSKLLRVIEERKILPIGSQKAIDVDVRIIAATNQKLFPMVEQGTFREDLYYRLNVLPLRLPPLRDRREDIWSLVHHFMDQLGWHMEFSPEAEAALEAYPWKGNVRELRNAVEYMASLKRQEIGAGDLPPFENMAGRRDEKSTGMAALYGEGHGMDRPLMPLVRSFLLNEGKRLPIYCFLTQELGAANRRGERPGRLALLERGKQSGQLYTEGEVRSGLSRLAQYGFVRNGGGRSGSLLTPEGEELSRELKRWNT